MNGRSAPREGRRLSRAGGRIQGGVQALVGGRGLGRRRVVPRAGPGDGAHVLYLGIEGALTLLGVLRRKQCNLFLKKRRGLWD